MFNSHSAPAASHHPQFGAADLAASEESSNAAQTLPPSNAKSSHRKNLKRAVPTKPPRPPNAWILYRSNCARMMQATDPHSKWSQGELSKLFASQWRDETPEVRRAFVLQAEARKEQHTLLYAGRKWPSPPPEKAGKPSKARPRSVQLGSSSSSSTKATFEAFVPPVPARTVARATRPVSWASSSTADSSLSPAEGRYLQMDLGSAAGGAFYNHENPAGRPGSVGAGSIYPMGDCHARLTPSLHSTLDRGSPSWPSVLFASGMHRAPVQNVFSTIPEVSSSQGQSTGPGETLGESTPTHLRSDPTTALVPSPSYLSYATVPYGQYPPSEMDSAGNSPSESSGGPVVPFLSSSAPAGPSFMNMNQPRPWSVHASGEAASELQARMDAYRQQQYGYSMSGGGGTLQPQQTEATLEQQEPLGTLQGRAEYYQHQQQTAFDPSPSVPYYGYQHQALNAPATYHSNATPTGAYDPGNYMPPHTYYPSTYYNQQHQQAQQPDYGNYQTHNHHAAASHQQQQQQYMTMGFENHTPDREETGSEYWSR